MPSPSQKGGGRRRPPRRRGVSSRPRRRAQPPVDPLLPTEDPPDIQSFREFALDPKVQEAIAAMGIFKPTPIQALGIGPVLEGRDIIAKAETGTGKTLVFGAPMMSRIDPDRASVLGLVLCPTRELAQQVAEVLRALGKPRGLRVALVVGGDPAGPQVEALQAGAQVVVGTPGRVIDLYEQKFLFFPWTEYVVLDEADEMLEIGFIDDVKKILNTTPEERQTMLFSATFPDSLLRLAREHTRNPAEVATASGIKTVDAIRQEYIVVEQGERPLTLIRLLEQSEPDDVFLVFCERRTEVEQLMRRLERLPLAIKSLHGGYDQAARFRVMSAFRTGEVKALIATDVASRGLDVDHVTHVVNYSVPRQVTDYTHRIGRTGRAGRDGKATTLVAHDQGHRWRVLLNSAPWEIERVEAPGRRRSSRAPEGRPRERRREPEGERVLEREPEAPREPRRGGTANEPVRLPENRPRRRRDDDDPPPRVLRRDGEGPAAEQARPSRKKERRSTRRREETEAGDSRPRQEAEPKAENVVAEKPARRRRSGRRTRSEEPKPPRDAKRRDEPPPRRERRRDESGGSGFGAGL